MKLCPECLRSSRRYACPECGTRCVVDLRDQRFGELRAIAPVRRQTRIVWRCLCDCGKPYLAKAVWLTQGRVRSCGRCTPGEPRECGLPECRRQLTRKQRRYCGREHAGLAHARRYAVLGASLSVREMAERVGISRQSMYLRLKAASPERAATRPRLQGVRLQS